MLPCRLLPTFLLLLVATGVEAKPPIGALLGGESGANPLADRNDLEGGIWEYKVLKRNSDKTSMLVGKIRIKQSAAFDVPGSAKGELLGEVESEGPGGAAFGPNSPPRLGVLDRITESNRGGDRIGDINYEKSRNSTSATPKVTFRFDKDDAHILSGEANVKYDTRGGGGVWRGSYNEVTPDNEKRRWTFELRFIED